VGELRVCRFEIAGQFFGLRLESVSEVAPMAALSRPPSMPSILEGILNLRGAAVPVLRVASLLGLPADPLDLQTPLVIVHRVRRGDMSLALLVNRVTGIVSIATDELAAISPADSFNGCVESRLTSGGETVHLLSLDRLLLERERRSLAQFQEIEASRLRQFEQELP
jgi:purine-binding chemotaxis protein CheW